MVISSFTSFFAHEIFFVTSSIIPVAILVLVVREALVIIIPLAPALVTSCVGSEVLVSQGAIPIAPLVKFTLRTNHSSLHLSVKQNPDRRRAEKQNTLKPLNYTDSQRSGISHKHPQRDSSLR